MVLSSFAVTGCPDIDIGAAFSEIRSRGYTMAVLLTPMVLLINASLPMAVLPLPMVLLRSASIPIAVLAVPVLLPASALWPVAVLSSPVVLDSQPAILCLTWTFEHYDHELKAHL